MSSNIFEIVKKKHREKDSFTAECSKETKGREAFKVVKMSFIAVNLKF